MIVWLVIGTVVLGVAGWAFWPRRQGGVYGRVRSAQRLAQGKGESYDNPSGPNFSGPF